jgi:hypothetical protein
MKKRLSKKRAKAMGQAGKGKAKRRGGPDYYRALVAKRKDRRKK